MKSRVVVMINGGFVLCKNSLKYLSTFLCVIQLLSCQTKTETYIWEGEISQDDNYTVASSYYTLLNYVQVDNEVSGTGYYMPKSDSTMHVLYTYTGHWQNDTLYLHENSIKEATQIYGSWVLKDIKLYYADEQQRQIKGTWTSQGLHRNYGIMNLSLK